MFSRFIHLVSCVRILLFLRLDSILLYVHTEYYLSSHLLMNIQFNFHLLTVVNNATVNMGLQLSVQVPAFDSLGYKHRSRIARSDGNSIFVFLRSCHTIFHNGYATLYLHQQCTEVSSFSTPLPTFDIFWLW